METFYKNVTSYRIARIAVLGGAGMVTVSPFFDWIHLSVHMNQDHVREGKSLFGIMLSGFSSIQYGFKWYRIVPLLFFLLVLLVGLYMLGISLQDTIWRGESLCIEKWKGGKIEKAIAWVLDKNQKYKLITHLIPLILSIFIYILVCHMKVYQNVMEEYASVYNTWKDLVEMLRESTGTRTGGYHLGGGFGTFLYWAGNIIFLLGYLFRYLLNTLNEDDFQLK